MRARQPPPPPTYECRVTTLHRSDVRVVWSGAQSDVRAAQLGRGALPRHSGFFLRAGRPVTLRSGVAVLANDERREREVGPRAPARHREREKDEFQSAGVHLAVRSRPLHCSASTQRCHLTYLYSSITIMDRPNYQGICGIMLYIGCLALKGPSLQELCGWKAFIGCNGCDFVYCKLLWIKASAKCPKCKWLEKKSRLLCNRVRNKYNKKYWFYNAACESSTCT